MNHYGKRLMACLLVMGLSLCTNMAALAKEETRQQVASGSDAAKPVCDKVQHINPSTKDIASPSDIMMLSTDGETFGFSIRKTGTNGELKTEAVFRLYRTYDDAITDKNAILFVPDDLGKIYTACGSSGCDNSLSDYDIYAGRVDIIGLPPETYYLSEVLAPEGYEKIPHILEIVLEDNGSVYYREMTQGGVLTLVEDGLLTIENRAVLLMPGTGGPGNALFYIFGVILIMAGIFMAYRSVKRR